MIICPICNKQLPDGARFCDACGAAVQAAPAPQPAPQPAWEAPAPQPAPEPAWEAPAPQPAPEPAWEAPAPQPAPQPAWETPAPQPVKQKKPLDKKLLIMGGAIVAAVIAVIVLLVCLLGGGKPDYALYVKDGELNYSNLSGKGKEMTSDYNSKNESVGATLSKDGKKLFYFDKEDGILFVREVSGNKDPVKIDTNVTQFVINDDADIVTYLKTTGDTKTLYQSNLKDKKKIAENVSEFYVTPDGDDILYLTSDGDLYPATRKEKGEKIASEVDEIVKVNKSLSKIYYLKDRKLYLKDGKKNDSVAKNVEEIINIYDSGEFYYVSHEQNDEEDLSYPVYDVNENGNETLNLDKSLENYAKQMGYIGYTLIYNDGKKDTKIGDVQRWINSAADDKAVVAYSTVDYKEATKNITAENFDDEIGKISKKATYYVLIEDKAYEIPDSSDINGGVSVASDGSKAIYMKDVSEEKHVGKLCEIEISGKLGKEKTIDDDVYTVVGFTEDKVCVYAKDYDKEKNTVDLYANKKCIDEDVSTNARLRLIEDTDTIVYMVDYNDEKQKGTLKSADIGGKAKQIAEDVHTFEIAPNGQILYLQDYNLSSNKGDLYISTNGKKGKKLDEDVRRILSYYTDTDYNNAFLGYED